MVVYSQSAQLAWAVDAIILMVITKSKGTSTLCRVAHSGTVQQGRTAKVMSYRKYMWTLHRLGCGMPFDVARPKNSIGKL